MSVNDIHDTGKRSTSRTRTSRPTTPLRPSSRSSFRESAQRSVDGAEPFPLNTFEPAFAELSDAVADLEANMMHFQLMHESLARFSESFASFLYGLNMNAFCVDFPEVNSNNRLIRTMKRTGAIRRAASQLTPMPGPHRRVFPQGEAERGATHRTSEYRYEREAMPVASPSKRSLC